MSIPMHLYRHDEIVIFRPFVCDVDADDWLWQGTSRNRLLGHNLRTAELSVVDIPEMEGEIPFSVFAWQEKLFIVFGQADFYVVHDPATGKTQRYDLPRERDILPITWYGVKLPGDRLMVFDRGTEQVLIFDAPDAKPRIIKCPWQGDVGAGSLLSDGLVYIFFADPSAVVRFDPEKEEFVDIKETPWPEAGLGRGFEHKGIFYVSDTAGGRLLPLDLATQEWGEPIDHPDFNKVFGYLGLGFNFQGKGYYNLSTYMSRSRMDRKTGKIVGPTGKVYEPGDKLPTVDGNDLRFMEKLVVFDPETRSFDYLAAPEQPDGMPLLCYSWNDETRMVVTGFVLPWGKPGVPQSLEKGHWLIMQSEPATEEPGFKHGDFSWDRATHINRYRRSYRRTSSLYIPEEPHSPPIVNMEGSAVHYPAGKQNEIARRAQRSDKATYWKGVCDRILQGETDSAARFRLILQHVYDTIFYNPIQSIDLRDPIAAHQSHDGRCGQGADIVLALCEAAGIEARLVELTAHVVPEAYYDGAWHCGDPLFFGGNQPSRDGQVLSVEQLKADPYFADSFPQPNFVYDPELMRSEDDFQLLGYVAGPWGCQPYFSYYLGAPKSYPPTLPTPLPVQRTEKGQVRLNWTPSFKRGGGTIEYELRIFEDRKCTQELLRHNTTETSYVWDVPEQNRMYYVEVRAMDDHRELQPDTWHPAARSNFVLVPEDQYGWYGVF